MDATCDRDIEVKRSSPDLIAELIRSLPRFLHKSKDNPIGRGSWPVTRVRTLVLKSKTDRLIQLLEPFQEWPQLLDPHLPRLLEPLISAFIEYLCLHGNDYPQPAGRHLPPNIIPLPRAVCKILYVFCKVRGQKVVSQFLNNEPQQLERMLEALWRWGQSEVYGEAAPTPDSGMIWEERFIMLLWLSHLMLAPFDLISMSSEASFPIRSTARCLRVVFPTNTPDIARRVATISDHYLGFPSKEREVAALLLSRLTARTDMQRIGLQKVLIDCTLMTLNGSHGKATPLSTYALIGILSFLAKFIAAAENETLKPLLRTIFESLQHARSDDSRLHEGISSSPLARKLIIKISRELAVAGIIIDSRAPGFMSCLGEGWLEEIIDQLLTALADKDTAVRAAASKALSVIAVPLDPNMVSQIVEIVLEKQLEDIYWVEAKSGQSISNSDFPTQGMGSATELSFSWKPNLAHVNAMSWHGLVLTLSQLIFHGSMPEHLIRPVVGALSSAIDFEQRSSLGQSIGTSVRDAACFGFWSLARKYKTEVLTVHSGSKIQRCGEILLTVAILDSDRNIRRGASAALQELIGRHPGEVNHGIELVQTIDYHAIALRSRAILEVARNTARMDESYWHTIFSGLTDWRGVGSADAESRRQAAQAIGRLATINSPKSVITTIELLRDQLQQTTSHQVQKMHGLLLALAEIVAAEVNIECGNYVENRNGVLFKHAIDHAMLFLQAIPTLWTVYLTGHPALPSNPETFATKMARLESLLRSELMCEAVCSLISALAYTTNLRGFFPDYSLDTVDNREENMSLSVRALELSLEKPNPHVLRAGAELAERLFGLLDKPTQEALVSEWADRLRNKGPTSASQSKAGVTAALAAVFKQLHYHEKPATSASPATSGLRYIGQDEETQLMPPMRALIVDTLLFQLKHAGTSVELRCTTLRSLTSGVLESKVITGKLSNALSICLEDYSIDQRGDVGSLVRIEAIDAVSVVLEQNPLSLPDRRNLAAKVCGLAVEKLDKVRWRAWNCLHSNWGLFSLGSRPSTKIADIAQTSSCAYFLQMMSFCPEAWVRVPLFRGYITSAGSGSESVLQASREAFVAYSMGCSPADLTVYCTDLVDIVREHFSNERLVVPAVEFLSFLFDAGVLPRLSAEDFGWGRLFNMIQKTHLKAQNLRKIEAAIRIYAGMAVIPKVKDVALRKLWQMLRHPFPKIRNEAADALFVITQDEEMMSANWSKSPKELENVATQLNQRLGLGE